MEGWRREVEGRGGGEGWRREVEERGGGEGGSYFTRNVGAMKDLLRNLVHAELTHCLPTITKKQLNEEIGRSTK